MSNPNIRKSPARFAIPKLSYRVWKVWHRNFDVFTKTIKVNFLPSLLEPILYLLAFGFGLGGFIPSIQGQSYIAFIAPALVAISVMNGSFFECTFASFVRMYFQKTFDAIVATPVSVEEVVAGELLWGATRATINTTIVLAVVAAFGLISSPLFLLVIPLAFFGGLNVCIYSYVLYFTCTKHRLLQFPLFPVSDADVLFMRHLLPFDLAPFCGTGSCNGSFTANSRCKLDKRTCFRSS